MAYDEELADRIRAMVLAEPDLREKRMFGGLAFLVGGHLAVSASGRGGLMIRVDPPDGDTLLAEPGVSPFEMRGRSLRGWLRVAPEACAEDNALRRWVAIGLDYARSLPPKE
jgi:hypothetical protein